MAKKTTRRKAAVKSAVSVPQWHPCDEYVDPLIRAIDPFCHHDDTDTIMQVVVDVTRQQYAVAGSQMRWWLEWNFGPAYADRFMQRVETFRKHLVHWDACRDSNLHDAVELHAIRMEAVELFGYLLSLGEQIRQQITFENLNSDHRFVPTPFQRMLLNLLHGRVMTQLAMMNELDVGSKETFNGKGGRGGMKELLAEGLVVNDRRRGGYYRPDAPPKDSG